MKLNIEYFPYTDSAALFEKVARREWAIYLDSGVLDTVPAVSKHADYDVLAIQPQCTLVFEQGKTHIWSNTEEVVMQGDPLSLLQSVIPTIDNVDNINCAYLPGALGYFSYDLARQYEALQDTASNDEALPEMAVGIYHVVVVVDHQSRQTCLVYLGQSAEVMSLVQEWRDLINQSDHVSNTNSVVESNELFACDRLTSEHLQENMSASEYREYFNKVRQYTIDGDCYQVNLAKQFSTNVSGDAWLTYQYLRALSPAPYGVYFNLPFAQVLSNSPESFIQCRERQVVTSPIKGTRPRDHSDAESDQQIARSLFNSEKDRAENLMIVDLMRNDLSRCCELHSVEVPRLFAVHSFANVHHLISTITGTLKKDLHSLDLLRSCFPGGSITGAPKIRAMEIIEELETHRRGLYCGSIGYIGVDGSLETNIAIRTIVIKEGVARFSAGGGLVIDSKVDEEYQEIVDKASMMTRALAEKN